MQTSLVSVGTKLVCAGLVAGAAASLSAQTGDSVLTRPSQTAWQLEAQADYSAQSEARHSGKDVGDLSVFSHQVSASYGWDLQDVGRMGVKLSHTGHELSLDAGIPLPDSLEALSVDLSWSKPLSPDWRLVGSVQTGLYGDDGSLDTSDFGLSGTVMAFWKASPSLNLVFGLRAEAHAEYPVLPVLGGVWTVSPKTKVIVGVPRTGVVHTLNEAWTLSAGLGYQGGTYRVDSVSYRPAGAAQTLSGSRLNYLELRLGAGALWRISEVWALDLEGGMAAMRRFHYQRDDFTVRTDAAPFVKATLQARF